MERYLAKILCLSSCYKLRATRPPRHKRAFGPGKPTFIVRPSVLVRPHVGLQTRKQKGFETEKLASTFPGALQSNQWAKFQLKRSKA